METGYDILFFWVARMIIMSTYCLNEIPFKTVYLHGLVRDEEGRKMSKSLGNAIDPLDMIARYGTDALRLSMLVGVTPGNDFKLYDEKIAGYRNFVNKLWNISRYILTSVDEIKLIEKVPEVKTLSDKWILDELNATIATVGKNLDEYNFSRAGEILQEFTWDKFADWYLEIAKIEKDKDEILLYVLQNILKLWHPFIPFITENIWGNFNEEGLIMIEKWPNKIKFDDGLLMEASNFDIVKIIIVSIRNLRAENKIEPGKKVDLTIIAGKNKDLIKSQTEIIKNLARCESVTILESGDKPENSISTVVGGIEIYISLAGIIDIEAEKERLSKDISDTEKYIKILEGKLSNDQFTANAPEAVVNIEKGKLSSAQEKLSKLQNQLDNLK